MNILEQEDLIKGLPDQALFQQADNPTGDIPQFLIISEIQRRTDMRKRFEAAEPQPQTTAAERIVSEGIGAAMAPQNSLPPPAMPAPPSNPVSQMDGSSPLMAQGMAAGGILGFSNGGGTKRQQIAAQAQAAARAQARTDKYNRETQQKEFMKNNPGASKEKLIDLITPSLDPVKFSNSVSRRQEAMRQADQRIADYRSGAISYEQMFGLANAPASEEPYSEEKPVAEIGNEVLDSNTLGRVGFRGDGNPFGDVRFEDEEEFGFTSSLTDLNPNISIGSGFPVESETDEVNDNSLLNNLGEDEQSILNVAEGRLGDKITVPRLDLEKPDLSSDVEAPDTQSLLDSIEAQRTGITDRLDARRSESQELINQIREEGKRDALSAALIQLGAGISSGDMASGLSQAGSAMTSANALARDAARAEQRGMRDYEESALAQADLLGVEGQRFAYEETKDAAVRKQALSQWDAEHGLRQDSLALEADFKQAGLDQDYDQFKSGLVMQVSDIAARAKSDNNTTRREAMRTFTSYMNTIRDVADDLPASMDADKKIQTVKDMQRQMIDALKVELGSEFFNAFAREAQEEAASPSSGEELSIEEIMSRYPGQ